LVGCGKEETPAPPKPYTPPKPKPVPVVALSPEENEARRMLSLQICSTCHLRPEPDALHRRGWVDLMEKMKPWVGLKPIPEETPAKFHKLYPTNALLTAAQFKKLTEYYVANAPAELPAPKVGFASATKIFERVDPKAPFGPFALAVTVADDGVWVSTAVTGAQGIYHRDLNGTWGSPLDLGRAATRVVFHQKKLYATVAGDYFPHDEAKGAVVRLANAGLEKLAEPLRRPCDLLIDEFADGLGMVFCEFGNLGGGVSWLDLSKPIAKREVLLEHPGALNAAAADFNGDGRKDFAVVTGQQRELVMLFIGQAGGGFEPRAVLPRQPAWGHSHLAVADFNNDQAPDLLITNGDNGDLLNTPIKPYHGVRIHLNDGKGNFGEGKFFAQPGAYRAVARDFDGDGDLDIVSLAYFADYKRSPESALLYLRQDGPMKFTRLSLPGATAGRWITMDAGDVDGDGDDDVVLASLNMGPGVKHIPTELRRQWGRQEVPVMILRNRSKTGE